LKGSMRIQGAVDGHWDPDDLVYTPYMDFRLFEIWTIVNPQDKNGNCCMNLDAAKCDSMTKHYEVIFDSLDESRETPNKLSCPISRRLYQRFNKFTFPTSAQNIFTETGAVPGNYAADAQPREHTRLHIVLTNIVGTGTLRIEGYNIFGEPVDETFSTEDIDGSGNIVGAVYFTTISKITVAGVTDMDVLIQDFDYGLKNPL